MGKIDISIVTVAFVNWKVLVNFIESVCKYNDIGNRLELIIVDNSPKEDRVKKYLPNDLEFDLIYIENDNNGFGAGNNVGARVAKGKYLAFFNPDLLLKKEIFQTIIDIFEQKKNISTIGGKLLSEDGSWALSFFWDYPINIFKRFVLRFMNKYDIYCSKNMCTSGADLIIRRQLFFDVGLFDENIFMYYEEIDLKNRIRLKYPELHSQYCKDIVMYHLEGKCSLSNKIAVHNELHSCIYVGKKYDFDYLKRIICEYNHLKIVNLLKKLMGKKVELTDVLMVYKEVIDQIKKQRSRNENKRET